MYAIVIVVNLKSTIVRVYLGRFVGVNGEQLWKTWADTFTNTPIGRIRTCTAVWTSRETAHLTILLASGIRDSGHSLPSSLISMLVAISYYHYFVFVLAMPVLPCKERALSYCTCLQVDSYESSSSPSPSSPTVITILFVTFQYHPHFFTASTCRISTTSGIMHMLL